MTSPPLITANITKNASNVPISLQFYKMFPIQQVFLLKNEKGAVETTAPLVIPVGFKPTTFRTFSRPSLSALKIKKVQPQKDAPKKVIPVGFKPTTFRTGI